MAPNVWWRRWGWAIIGVGTLALGIGATTALFSIVHAVLLQPLPIPHPGQVDVVLEGSSKSPLLPVSYPDFLDLRSSNRTFAVLAAEQPSLMALAHLGAPAMIPGLRVSHGFFQLLGARPMLGRTFTAAEDTAGAPAVVVVSSRFWRQRLGSNPACLGQAIELDGLERTIVGVMPDGWPLAGGAAQFWTPLAPYMAMHAAFDRRSARLAISLVGRRRPGVTLSQARGDLASISVRLAHAYPASNAGITTRVRPFLSNVAGGAEPVLWGLLLAVGLLLLLACANLANLLLARAARQQTEDALRAALGATPARLLWRRLRESFGLGVAGAAAGCVLALVALHAAPSLLASLPRTHHPTLDAPVLAFAAALAVLTALLCGLAPAIASSRTQPARVLAQSAAGGVGGGRRGRSALVASQLGLALLLLAGAALVLRSVAAQQAVNPGFNPEGTLSFVVGLPSASYPSRAGQLAFFEKAERRLAHIPGVTAAGGAFPLPFAVGGIAQPVAIPGQPAPAPGQAPTADVAHVRGRYFAAMGIPLLRGRAFTAADNGSSAPVAIVDDAFVHRFWPGLPLSAALGKTMDAAGSVRRIVGIVGHVHESALIGPIVPEAYVPHAQGQLFTNALFFVLRTPLADPMSLRAAAAARIAAIDPTQPITQAATMQSLVQGTLAQPRLVLSLLALFALLALALAAIGVYSALSYAVARRTREIGVRMAMGANRGRLLWAVLVEGMRPAWMGAAAGLALVLAFGHLAAAFLPGISAHDPLALAAAAVILLAVAAVACLLPARRAAAVDPLTALREP